MHLPRPDGAQFTLLVGAFVSAFINNVPVVVLFLPIPVSVSIRTATPASLVRMPMGFATLIGGMCTTIGNSTNLLMMNAGEYTFNDFLRAGVPLLDIMWIALS